MLKVVAVLTTFTEPVLVLFELQKPQVKLIVLPHEACIFGFVGLQKRVQISTLLFSLASRELGIAQTLCGVHQVTRREE